MSDAQPANRFYDAVLFADIADVEAMLNQQPELVGATDEYEFTALHIVMTEGRFDVMQLLIDRGADVHAVNDKGLTPLHLAQYAEAVDLLVKAGADVNVRDEAGQTPLHLAAEENEDAVPLDVIEALLLAGADVNAKDDHGSTPAMIARRRDDDERAALLNQHGGT